MTCGNCARHVTEALQSVPGVESATVNLDAQRATVRWGGEADSDVPALIKAVEEEGFSAQLLDEAASASAGESKGGKLSGWSLNLWVGLPAMLLLMAGEWIFGLAMTRWFQWLAFAVATMVQVTAGARFYLGAWGQLKAGHSNMDTLVALGSTTAYAYSTWALLANWGGHVYFMEAVAIITLISLGHWMESRVSAKASSALRKLLGLAPALARRFTSGGTEKEVPVSDLVEGDLVVLRPGDRVPTDGQVSEGQSAVDESMLTGESVPVDKVEGSRVYAGTTNLNGRLMVKVTATGEETALAHIIAAVHRAQTSRANIQRLGDRVSNVFVPIVVAVALAAALWWGFAPASALSVHDWLGQYLWPAHPPEGALAAAFLIAAAVLIIACPCAMGLATPAAIMAGANAAARRGILIRDGVALEKAGQVTAVVFDKTGTLTVGKPDVVEAWGEKSASALASALARNSTHPLSQAIARLPQADLPLEEWKEVHGAGVQSQVRLDGNALQLVRLGSLRWLRECGVLLEPGEQFIAHCSAQGATVVGLGIDNELRALFAVKDTLKTGAAAVVTKLKRQGLRTYLVTGDNARTAVSLARQVGIAEADVFAEVRPEEKSQFVKQLQAKGERVAFVGDGINDAPALEQADLGIAVSRASDIAREAADIILLKSEVEAVPESLGLARATLRTIKQNLFWAFFYNVIGIPLAALGFMSPILCAAAMGLSDLVVIGNALRLSRWRQ
jgi:Cu+-exporting ATPase